MARAKTKNKDKKTNAKSKAKGKAVAGSKRPPLPVVERRCVEVTKYNINSNTETNIETNINPNIDPYIDLRLKEQTVPQEQTAPKKQTALEYLRTVINLPSSIKKFLQDETEMKYRFPPTLTGADHVRDLEFIGTCDPSSIRGFNSAKPVQNVMSLLIYVSGDESKPKCERCAFTWKEDTKKWTGGPKVFPDCVVPHKPDMSGDQLLHRKYAPFPSPANTFVGSRYQYHVGEWTTDLWCYMLLSAAFSCANCYYDGEGTRCNLHAPFKAILDARKAARDAVAKAAAAEKKAKKEEKAARQEEAEAEDKEAQDVNMQNVDSMFVEDD